MTPLYVIFLKALSPNSVTFSSTGGRTSTSGFQGYTTEPITTGKTKFETNVDTFKKTQITQITLLCTFGSRLSLDGLRCICSLTVKPPLEGASRACTSFHTSPSKQTPRLPNLELGHPKTCLGLSFCSRKTSKGGGIEHLDILLVFVFNQLSSVVQT